MSGGGRIIRAPNHLGDAVAALPAIVADGSDVLVVRWLAPVLEMAGLEGRVIPFDRGLPGFLRAAAELRRCGYAEGVLLSAAFSAAWLFRWGGVRHLRGTTTDGRSLLLRDGVRPETLWPHHRIDAYRLLLGLESGSAGEAPQVHRITAPAERVGRWRGRLSAGPGPLVGLFPGAHAPARRWPEERFVELAGRLHATGARLVVLGGPPEAELTARVAAAAPGSLDAGGRTDLFDLAALLSLCDLVVTNDTGPMHLAGAVGTPTVSLWGPSDPDEVRQVGAPDFRVTGPELPCKPCYRNRCGRRGAGTLLPDAHEECMRLIEVDSVIAAVEAALAQGATGV
ncbi:MAG TPA: glycosyltransferase family 9 protein [Longimicrobiales bacterium]|nr:glycosyltransferase family 9 protein [Longimicrobiales bacterium]